MSKIRNCFESFGLISGMKMMFLEIEDRFLRTKSNNICSIYSWRTGKDKFYFRKNTSDYELIKTILMSAGEYDFLIGDQEDILKQAQIIVDAGANIGVFSRICRNLNKKAEIIAIEPEQSNFDLLVKNLELMGGIHLLKNGLWNKSANLIIEQEDADKWAFTVKETNQNSAKIIKAISVPEIMQLYNIDFIDIFKCDIEGSEFEVFDESCKSWVEKVGMFIIETHNRFKEGSEDRVLKVMEEHGFEKEKIAEDWIFINKENNRMRN